nr:MAG TPA: hypothetical protein [Caudoviricetes sp.]
MFLLYIIFKNFSIVILLFPLGIFNFRYYHIFLAPGKFLFRYYHPLFCLPKIMQNIHKIYIFLCKNFV